MCLIKSLEDYLQKTRENSGRNAGEKQGKKSAGIPEGILAEIFEES